MVTALPLARVRSASFRDEGGAFVLAEWDRTEEVGRGTAISPRIAKWDERAAERESPYPRRCRSRLRDWASSFLNPENFGQVTLTPSFAQFVDRASSPISTYFDGRSGIRSEMGTKSKSFSSIHPSVPRSHTTSYRRVASGERACRVATARERARKGGEPSAWSERGREGEGGRPPTFGIYLSASDLARSGE